MDRRAGAVEAAAAQFEAIEREAGIDEPYERARAAYWRARMLADRGEEGLRAALAVWRELAERYPTDYYGLLARVRLGERARAAAKEAVPVAPPAERVSRVGPAATGYDPGPLRDDPHLRAGLRLARMGFDRAAAQELEEVPLSRLKPGDSLDPVVLVADLLDRCGDHRAAHQLLRTRARAAFRHPPDAESLRAWHIAYPPAYRQEVLRWAAPAGVPPDLVQALMREESALDPRVVSPAGALGLTQLMLPTARSVATRLRLARPSRDDLLEPELNIRLGAQYLGGLLRRFDGQVALALAAYNAGGGAVSRWVEARDGLALDELVEEIPVEETRGYVKRVLRSYAAYRALYGADESSDASQLLRVAGS